MKWRWGLLMGLLALLLGPARPVRASGAAFAIAPVLPASQRADTSGYFDLVVKPGQAETLRLKVTNLTNAAHEVTVTPTNAVTLDNGQISYAPSQRRDASATLALTDLLGPRQVVQLAPHAVVTVTFPLQAPATAFSGQVIGGLYATEPAAAASSGSGVQIQNQFALVVAVQLQTSTTQVPPRLNLLSVAAKTEATKPVLQYRLQNDQPRLFGKLTLKATLTKAGQTAPVATETVSNLAMAPTSAFTHTMPLPAALAAGKYTLKVTATSGHSTWQLTRNLTITAAAAAAATPKAPTAASWPWWLLLAGLVIVGGVLLIAWRRKAKHAQS